MKTIMLKFVSLVAIPMLSAVHSNAEPWRGITPLKSTRADVERLLGKPVPEGVNFLAVYKLENEEVHVRYAIRGLCREPKRCECNVPDDTVIDISVESKVKATFSTAGIARGRFERFPHAENTKMMIYYNSAAGLTYTVSESDDKILSIQYGPASKDCESVLTKATKASPSR